MESASGIDTPVQTSPARAPEQLRFTGTGGSYFGIWIVNLLLTIVTLGIYSAWAKVRLARFQAQSMRLVPASDLQEFVAAGPETIGAVGAETATVFDFDIAL